MTTSTENDCIVKKVGVVVGDRISLMTTVKYRYEGQVTALDWKEATISLENVTCHGLEDRETLPSKCVDTCAGKNFGSVTFWIANIVEIKREQPAEGAQNIHADSAIVRSEPAGKTPTKSKPSQQSEQRPVPRRTYAMASNNNKDQLTKPYDIESANAQMQETLAKLKIADQDLISSSINDSTLPVSSTGCSTLEEEATKSFDESVSFYEPMKSFFDSITRSENLTTGKRQKFPSTNETTTSTTSRSGKDGGIRRGGARGGTARGTGRGGTASGPTRRSMNHVNRKEMKLNLETFGRVAWTNNTNSFNKGKFHAKRRGGAQPALVVNAS